MRKKRLIIGLFTAALVAAAVPVASAATSQGTSTQGRASAQSCSTWQFKMPARTAYWFHGKLRWTSGSTVVNVHRKVGSGTDRAGNRYGIVIGNIYHYTNRGGNLGWHRVATAAQTTVYTHQYLRCW